MTREEFDSIMYVSDNGIMTGYETGEFAPDAFINRAQFVQTLYNHSGDNYRAYESIFTDVTEGTWYYDAVYWAYNEGIINGTSSTTFHPARNITTAEALTILYRYATNYLGENYDYADTLILTHFDYDDIANWAKDAMNWALAYNIINPAYQSVPLYPNAFSERKEIAVIMRNFEKEAIGLTYLKAFSFTNTATAFFSNVNAENKYAISETEYISLCDAISSYYSTAPNTARIILDTIEAGRSDNWSGACHGMSTIVLLDMLGKIDFNRSAQGYSNIYSLSLPRNNSSVLSGIHYYQLAVFAQAEYRSDYGIANNLVDTGFVNLIQNVKNNGVILVDYFWKVGNNTHGHSVLVTDIEEVGDGEYLLYLYNPNGMGSTIATASVNGESVTFNGEELSTLGFFTIDALNTLDYLDIDGTYNAQGVVGMSTETATQIAQTGEDYLQGKALISIPATDFEVRNADGESLVYADGEISGSLPVYSCKPIASGPDAVAKLLIVVDESESFLCEFVDDEERFVSISSKDYSAAVSGDGINEVYVGRDGVKIDGIGMDLLLKCRIAHRNQEYINLQFTDEDTIELEVDDDTFSIEGVTNEYFIYG